MNYVICQEKTTEQILNSPPAATPLTNNTYNYKGDDIYKKMYISPVNLWENIVKPQTNCNIIYFNCN